MLYLLQPSSPRQRRLNLAVGLNPRWESAALFAASAAPEFSRGFKPTVGVVFFGGAEAED
jgi:hypothetical protein